MNTVLKKIRQSDAFNKENRVPYIKAVVMMGVFTFVFLGIEYLFVNTVSAAVSGDRAVAAQNYALGVSTVGFLLYCPLCRFCAKALRSVFAAAAAAGSVACILCLCRPVSYNTALAIGLTLFLILGIFGSAVYYKALCLIESNKHIARLVGLSYMLGVLLQFINNNVIRTQNVEAVVLSLFLSGLTVMLVKAENNSIVPAFPENDENGKSNEQGKKSLAIGLLLVLIVALMTCVFSTLDNAVTLYHANGTADIGQWPRILLAVGGAAAGFVFDIADRKYMSSIMYCVMILSTICIAVLEYAGPFVIGLLVFYVSAGFFAVFFAAAFMELARYTKLPDLWAGIGRAVNNAVAVCITGASLKLLTSGSGIAAVIAALLLFAAVSIAVAVYTFKRKAFFDEIYAPDDTPLDAREKLQRLSEEFGLTPRETEVFNLLITTEDSIQVIADGMYVSRRTLERYISAIYEKTGVKSRVGLIYIYNNR